MNDKPADGIQYEIMYLAFSVIKLDEPCGKHQTELKLSCRADVLH